jgi:hypothetical protein
MNNNIQCKIIIDYLENNFNLDETNWNKEQKRSFIAKFSKFVIRNDG